MKGITERQQRVLSFIKEYYKRESLPPTVREIAEGLGFKSVNAVREHLRLIEKKGLIELRKGVARGIFPVEKKAKEPAKKSKQIPFPEHKIIARELPIIGNVAAGTPITAEENIESSLYVDPDLFHGNDQFVLRVHGDSMIEVGVFDGDFVIVQKQQTARDGEIVVGLLNGDTTLKTYFKKEDHIVLHPENQFLEDIIVQPYDTFSVVGTMVGLIRKY